GYGADCIADNVHDSCWSADTGRVIDGMRLYLCLHPLCHVALRLRDNHSIGPLRGREHSPIFGGCVLRERRREGFLGEPNQTIAVRCKLWCLGMRFEAIEHVSDFLALIGSKSG